MVRRVNSNDTWVFVDCTITPTKVSDDKKSVFYDACACLPITPDRPMRPTMREAVKNLREFLNIESRTAIDVMVRTATPR